ncbi:MAG: LysR family transcriptional regulator [Thalassospira sp.]|jgi:DNA-binding transcriptional LysR family regulator|uniref:LysR family transcriptional regulator n=1 Tax=Thalassospira sp. GB04J01 TaxID=1485225 RepID=UPI000C0EEBFA|nr:LysR family transcriptional regulator [Thalassospira sp. GB04J01]MBV17426.1 LysR family transcriptional regulator [Thalassospira sp.]|tara:strand:+ start:1914 stop:2834 length:921 start_codon:yes stop_codon:yes gene_type:complete
MSAVDRMELMQTFVRIVDSGSLSAAAAHLGTTQPTVSRRLRSLENLLGVELLLRSTHALKLTDDGERCYGHARRLMEGWAALEEEIKGAGAEPVGRLRVKVPHAFGQDQLVGPLVSYLKRYNQVSVDWILNDRPPDFITENIDCAIHVGPVTGPSHVAVLLAEIPRIVVAAPELVDHTKLTRVEQLADLPWVALSTFYMHEIALQSTDFKSTVRFPVSPRMSSDSLFAIHRAALDGLGAAIVSSWIADDDLKNGRLVNLFPEWQAPSLPVYLVYPYASYYPIRMEKFFEAVRDFMPGLVGVRPRHR